MSEEDKKESMSINEGEVVGPWGEQLVDAVMNCAPKGFKKAVASFGNLIDAKSGKVFSIGFIITESGEDSRVEDEKVVYDDKEVFSVDEVISRVVEENDCPCSTCKMRRSLEDLKNLVMGGKRVEDLNEILMKTFNPKHPHGDA